MKYNKSEIMKSAWRIYKRNSGSTSFGEALKQAWAGAKFMANTNPNNFEVGEFIIWENDGIVRSGDIVSMDGGTLVARLQRSDFEMTLKMSQIDKTFILNRNTERARAA